MRRMGKIAVTAACGLIAFVYEYAVNTVLLAFCEDCEEHDGAAQFAPPLLMHALGQAQAHHDKQVADANEGAVPLNTSPRGQFMRG